MNTKELEAMVADLRSQMATLTERVSALESAGGKPGPKAERAMNEIDAYRVRFGDLKAADHKAAAEALGLSYGQVFSCRGGYTFKRVKEDGKRNEDGTMKEAAK